MAQLILTPEEEAAISWLDLDDDALGKLCRTVALQIQKEPSDDTEAKRIWAGTAMLMLCSIISDLGATSGEYAIEDLSLHGEKRGNWKVIVQKEGEE